MKTKMNLIVLAALVLIALAFIGCTKEEPQDELFELKDSKIHLKATGTPTQPYNVIYAWQTKSGERRTKRYVRQNTFDTVFELNKNEPITYVSLKVVMFDNTFTLSGDMDVWENGQFSKTITVENNQLNYSYGNSSR